LFMLLMPYTVYVPWSPHDFPILNEDNFSVYVTDITASQCARMLPSCIDLSLQNAVKHAFVSCKILVRMAHHTAVNSRMGAAILKYGVHGGDHL